MLNSRTVATLQEGKFKNLKNNYQQKIVFLEKSFLKQRKKQK